MAWTQRTATDFRDCLDQVRQFTQKAFAAGTVTPGGGNTGDGYGYGASASHQSVAETWTLTCTTGGGNDTAIFSVVGSVSGTQTSATAGVPYSIDEISFVIVSGDTDFVATDSFTFDVATSTAEWVQDKWDTDRDGNGNYELIQHGIGAGSDEIYGAWYTLTNDSTYWNWGVSGLTGYVSGNSLANQPGWHPYYDCLNNASFDFICIFTSRHIKVIPTAVSGETGGSYIGWILPHATPSQWTYPIFGGGSTDDASQVIGGTEDDHTCYWNAYSDEYSGAILDVTAWVEINRFSPRHYGSFESWRPGLVDDEMRLYEAVPIDESSNSVYGTLEGVYYPTPYISGGGLLSAGDIIITDSVVTMCFKDVFRTAAGNLVAMDLMGD
jgi:hypothetical protein